MLLTRSICAGALILASAAAVQGALAQSSAKWEALGDDLEIAQVNVPVNSFLSSELLLLRSALKQYRVAVVKASEFGWKRSTVKAIGKSSRATVAINANFFDEQGRALGLVISRGILNQPLHKGGNTLTGVFQILNSAMQIVNRSDFDPHGVTEAVQAGPRLIIAGTRAHGLRESSYPSKRSGVCIDSSGRLIIYCVSSGLLGLSIDQLQAVLLQPEIGCVDALNLDGGGSSQLFISKEIPDAPSNFSEMWIEGSDPVPVALGLFPTRSP